MTDERDERRHERRALLEDVAAVEDRAHDRRVRRRAPDAAVLERLDQRRLGVARRRARLVPLRLERRDLKRLADGQRRQAPLLVLLRAGLVASLLVGPEEARERDHRAGRPERHGSLLRRGRAELDRHRLPAGVLHLRGDRALPDQVVQGELVARDLPLELVGRPEHVPGGPDRLVGLLGVLDRALVAARLGRHGLGAVGAAACARAAVARRPTA